MDLRKNLVQRYSKQNTLEMRNWIGDDPDRFQQLMDLYLGEDALLAQRAAWVMSHVHEVRGHMIQPYLSDLLDVLTQKNHDAVKRNALKVLAECDLPEELLGVAADRCFTLLEDQKMATAIRVHAMTVLWNICKKEPDLSFELGMYIEQQLPYGSAGFKNRGKKILHWIAKHHS